MYKYFFFNFRWYQHIGQEWVTIFRCKPVVTLALVNTTCSNSINIVITSFKCEWKHPVTTVQWNPPCVRREFSFFLINKRLTRFLVCVFLEGVGFLVFVDTVTKRCQLRSCAVTSEAHHPSYKYKNDTWDACLTACAALWIELTNINLTTDWLPVHF